MHVQSLSSLKQQPGTRAGLLVQLIRPTEQFNRLGNSRTHQTLDQDKLPIEFKHITKWRRTKLITISLVTASILKLAQLKNRGVSPLNCSLKKRHLQWTGPKFLETQS